MVKAYHFGANTEIPLRSHYGALVKRRTNGNTVICILAVLIADKHKVHLFCFYIQHARELIGICKGVIFVRQHERIRIGDNRRARVSSIEVYGPLNIYFESKKVSKIKNQRISEREAGFGGNTFKLWPSAIPLLIVVIVTT